MYAGAIWSSNDKYFLCNGEDYFTMSPLRWDSTGSAQISYVRSDGWPANYNTIKKFGIRPVINLKSDITFSSGNGTQNNPYIVAN